MKAIGLDIGTTTISAVVLDLVKKKILTVKNIRNDSAIRSDNPWEAVQDPRRIIKKAMDLLDEIIGNYPDFYAIGLTGQMHGIVYLNKGGHFISPLYTWQDQSGNQPVFDGVSVVERAKREYGLPVATGYGLATYLYHANKGLVPEGARYICTIMDYLGMKLSGRKTPLMHVSNADSLGFFDTEKCCFDLDAISAMGGDTTLLPEVTATFDCLGTFRQIPVTVALGDNQASFLGSVGVKEHVLLANVGTGGQISLLSDQYFEAPGIEARPILPDRYLLAGSSLCAGKSYEIIEEFFRAYAVAAGLKNVPQYDVMAALLSDQSTGKESLTVETTFQGTRMEPDKKGAITGIGVNNFTPQALIRGTLEGMARELYSLYEVIREGTGIEVSQVIASGNGLRKNPVLMKIFQELFQAPLILSPYEEEAACGAAISATLRDA